MDANIRADYLAMFAEMGIRQGDIVLVTSDIRKLCILHMCRYKEILTPNDIIDILQYSVGVEGTLLFPTYNWDFCKGIMFDYYNTPCMTGSLGVAALKRSDFKRTHHPIYSCAAWGKNQDELYNMQYVSSFGEDSIFGWLDRNNAKNLVIEVPVERHFGYTFVHYVEQMSKSVSYRFEKNFTADYKDEHGHITKQTYSMYVRYLDRDVEAHFFGLDKILIEKGISKRYVYDGIEYKVIDMHASYAPILDDIVNNHSRNIARFKGQ